MARAAGFLVVAIAYGGVWLAVAMFFSVVFRSTATSALCALGLCLFFFILWPMIANAIVIGFAPREITSLDQYVGLQEFALAMQRLSPGTLFSEALLGLLNPETRTLGFTLPTQMRGAIMGAPLPLDQSLLLMEMGNRGANAADLNGDGVVDEGDVELMKTCIAQGGTVPAPGKPAPAPAPA